MGHSGAHRSAYSPVQSRLRRGVGFAILALITSNAAAQAPPATAPPTFAAAQQLIAQQKFADAVPLLNEALKSQPLFGPAWMSLGAARRGMGMTDSAIAAYTHALTRPGVARQATLQLFLINADIGNFDDAYNLFDGVRKSGIDYSAVIANREVAKLRGDARFAELFLTPKDFENPFVENVHIIHEWRGENAGDEFGWIARGIGDVDGDGIADVAISATANLPTGTSKGRVYAYSGKSGKLLWKHEAAAGAFYGNTLESAGDVNHDGIPDVVVGAPGISTAFVYSGKDGSELRKIVGDSLRPGLGQAVAGVGDLNHDGYADIVATAPTATAGKGASTGRVTIYSGKDGSVLQTLDGENAGDSFGSTVGVGGGRYFVVGAPGAGAQRAGRIYVFDGLNSKPVFVQQSDSTSAAFGAMFASVVGDVDGDGIPDMYATDFANTANGPGSGRAYIFSGKNGSPLYVKSGAAGDNLGIGAGRTGDVNGDGRADFIVAAWQHRSAAWSGGQVQVFSGKDGSILQTFTGRIPGETLGFDAVGVGDVDGDGKTDYLLTSAWSMVNGVRSGRVYIVSGAVENPKSNRK